MKDFMKNINIQQSFIFDNVLEIQMFTAIQIFKAINLERTVKLLLGIPKLCNTIYQF